MLLLESNIEGVFELCSEPHKDHRGFFKTSIDTYELRRHGLGLFDQFAQVNMAHNIGWGTLRGLHWTAYPNDQAKLVTCTQGMVYDVVLDVRPGSPTYGKWDAYYLSASNTRWLYVPPGIAHGYLTLEQRTTVLYMVDKPYVAEAARGIRYDDPQFKIAWPLDVRVISEADKNWPVIVTE